MMRQMSCLICLIMAFSLKEFTTTRHVISKEAAGVIGAIVLSVRKIFSKLRDYSQPEESQILQYFYSEEFSSEAGRVFGTDRGPMLTEVRSFLAKCFHAPTLKSLLSETSAQDLNQMVEGGALVESDDSYTFSSPLAKRFFIQHIFPSRSTEVPQDLRTLVQRAIQHMSAAA